MSEFDVESELAMLEAQKRLIRKKRYRASSLDRYHGELMQLRNAGATPADLQRWLRKNRIDVHLTTVTRWLEKRHGKIS